MDAVNQLILFGGLLALAAIVLTAASRSGAPLLLVFLGVGMLAGEDGIGGVRFDDFELSFFVGNLALAVILFDGGLRTRYESFRAGLWPAVSLATVGVVVTAGVTGFIAARLLDLPLLEGLLIGAIVGSTDAAAVFALLHTRGMQLKQRVAATLEIESGSNDPMAVFLTVVLIELLLAGKTTLDATVLASFVQQMGLGALLGIAAGHALAWLIDRLNLVAAGLYPLLALSGGLLTFGLTGLLGGSGFLAVYLAGLTLGNRRPRGELYILRVHDGLAWLAQLAMFLLLGLLATPTRLLEVAVTGLVVALALMLVARPLAVLLCLAPFRLPWREQVFIAWVGLRGAVPIVLTVFPLFAGLENAYLYFNIAFFVVLVSLVVQGWTIAPLARLLGLEAPPLSEPVQRLEIDYPGAQRFRSGRLPACGGIGGGRPVPPGPAPARDGQAGERGAGGPNVTAHRRPGAAAGGRGLPVAAHRGRGAGVQGLRPPAARSPHRRPVLRHFRHPPRGRAGGPRRRLRVRRARAGEGADRGRVPGPLLQRPAGGGRPGTSGGRGAGGEGGEPR